MFPEVAASCQGSLEVLASTAAEELKAEPALYARRSQPNLLARMATAKPSPEHLKVLSKPAAGLYQVNRR